MDNVRRAAIRFGGAICYAAIEWPHIGAVFGLFCLSAVERGMSQVLNL